MSELSSDITITFSYGVQSSFDVAKNANSVPVFLLGVAPNAPAGKFPANELVKITSPLDTVDIFGTDLTDNTFVQPVNILHRYGCKQIFLVRIEPPAEPTEQQTRDLITGTENPPTGLHLVKSVYTKTGQKPIAFTVCEWVVTETTATLFDLIMTDALAIADAAGSQLVVNFPDTMSVDAAVTLRQGSLGMGKKNNRFVACYGHLRKKGETEQEPLAYHAMAAMASMFHTDPSRSPGGSALVGVDEIVESMNLSTTEKNSDNEKLTDVGVVCPNILALPVSSGNTITIETQVVLWGIRSAGYPQDKTQFSYLQALPFRDLISSVLQMRSAFYLHRPCDLGNARAILRACSQGLQKFNDVKIMFLLDESNFSERRLKFRTEYTIGNITESIHHEIRLTGG